MAIPATATYWAAKMDPSDLIDYVFDLSTDSILETGELVSSYTLTVQSEGVAVGFEIQALGGYEPSIATGNIITAWFAVNIANQGDVAFDAGVDVPIELEINTDSTPSRRIQRTFVVTVVNQ